MYIKVAIAVLASCALLPTTVVSATEAEQRAWEIATRECLAGNEDLEDQIINIISKYKTDAEPDEETRQKVRAEVRAVFKDEAKFNAFSDCLKSKYNKNS